MKNISSTDLLLIPELSHLRMLDIINPEYDSLIAPFLKTIGFDLDYAIEYIPCQHRNMQGKVVIAYVIAGEVEINNAFQTSVWATHEDHMIAAGYRDIGLAKELAERFTACREYGDSSDGFPPDQSNPDEKEIIKQIRVLEELLFIARGNLHKNDGSRVKMGEHGVVEASEKRRKKVERYVKNK